MVQKSSRKEKLDALPASDSDYWKDAEVQRHELKPLSECKHRFVRKRNEAECINCHMGLFLSPGDSVKDSHIYRGKKLVI